MDRDLELSDLGDVKAQTQGLFDHVLEEGNPGMPCREQP